jgi:hypothetical protein
MTKDLSIGDVCEIIETSWYYAKYQGTECVIVDFAADVERCGKIHYDCHVKLCDGKVLAAQRRILRKKKPPREDLKLVRWDQCPWQPESINV